MLRNRLLAALLAEPGIGIEQLRSKLGNIEADKIKRAVSHLVEEGYVEMQAGKYRLLPNKVVLPTAARPSDFIAPIPVARLMAGR